MRWLTIGAWVGLMFGCGPAAPVATTVRFAARVGSEVFQCGKSYATLGTPVAPQAEAMDLRFYVHDVVLLTAQGAEHPLTLDSNAYQTSGVGMLDFENAEGACTQGDATVNTELSGSAQPGPHDRVRFTLGVPTELNHQDLTSQPSPLNKSSLFWSWRMGHIFLAATTRAPAPGTMTGFREHLTHVGATECTGDPTSGTSVVSCAKTNRPTYTLPVNPDTQAIVFDLRALKEGLDITQSTGCHSSTEVCSTPFAHLGITWSTGALTPETQTVFRAESL
jgi:uncharacterized repeat protein (TIGR04052 family)